MKKNQLINEIEYRQKYNQYINKQKKELIDKTFTDLIVDQLKKYQDNLLLNSLNPESFESSLSSIPQIDFPSYKDILNKHKVISFEEYLKNIKNN